MDNKTIKHQYPNKLLNESSPYLRQHAYNPVQWHPWNDEALEKAKQEDKPIFLSIGYSSCHWCHIMAHESFENEEIAEILNNNFVSIKVDREERPDLDEIYMNAVQLMGIPGGWPLNLFLTPTLEPFYGGTYFPPIPRNRMPGFNQVLTKIAEHYKINKTEIKQKGSEIINKLQSLSEIPQQEAEISDFPIISTIKEFKRDFDFNNGGFGNAPKFPQPIRILFLLKYWARTKDPIVLQMASLTLEKMAKGGIYDQLGGGFHRYSVDNAWRVPHFEKMLYDNALLAQSYLEGFQATKNPFFRQIAEEILEYIIREMISPKGGFYSAQDADTEEEEGKFYIWSQEEMIKILGTKEGRVLSHYFGVTQHGNFENNKNILYIAMASDVIAELEKILVTDIERIILEGKIKLFSVRNTRTAPFCDKKTIASWNGLMLSAFALASRVLNNKQYLDVALLNASFLQKHLYKDGIIYHAWINGNVKQPGFLDDYACIINALLDLFESSFDQKWLSWAIELVQIMNNEFKDKDSGGYFYTGETGKKLIARSKSPYDNNIPSGNSISATIFFRLAKLTGNEDYRKKGVAILQSFSYFLTKMPEAMPQMLTAINYHLFPGPEIIITGKSNAKRTEEFLEILAEHYDPNRLVLIQEPTNPLAPLIPWAEGKNMQQNNVTGYYCQNNSCLGDVTMPDDLRALLHHVTIG